MQADELWRWALSGATTVILGLVALVYNVLSAHILRVETNIWAALENLRTSHEGLNTKILERLSNIPTRDEVRIMLRDIHGGG